MVVGGIIAGAIAATPTLMNLGTKIGKQYSKYGGSDFGKAVQFGLGYGGSTAVGYNLVPQFGKRNTNKTSSFNLNQNMPYGRSYGRTRKIRVWSKRYRRYIWVVPRKTYGRRYSRNYRRGYY